jgi:hypothetical protein
MANNSRIHSWLSGGEFKPGILHPYYGKKRPEHSAKLLGRKRGRNKNTIVVIRKCSRRTFDCCWRSFISSSYRL